MEKREARTSPSKMPKAWICSSSCLLSSTALIGVYLPLRSPSSPSKAFERMASTLTRSSAVLPGGRVKPLMLRKLRMRLEMTYLSKRAACSFETLRRLAERSLLCLCLEGSNPCQSLIQGKRMSLKASNDSSSPIVSPMFSPGSITPPWMALEKVYPPDVLTSLSLAQSSSVRCLASSEVCLAVNGGLSVKVMYLKSRVSLGSGGEAKAMVRTHASKAESPVLAIPLGSGSASK
mmetsp:Transcript_2731/g.6715  ORF Transcript_2731/g.6715 Transcript_2731/m.6715 type:complete len:234 (+) Transcript_2731:912-1613(+)